MATRKRDRLGRFTRAPTLKNAPPVADITAVLKENRPPPERAGYTAPAKAGVVQAPSLKAPAGGAPSQRRDSNPEANHPSSKQPSPCSIASSSSEASREAPDRSTANHRCMLSGCGQSGPGSADTAAFISKAECSRPNSLEVWTDPEPASPQQPPPSGQMAEIDQKFARDPLSVPEYRREIFCHLVDSATRNRLTPQRLAERQPTVTELKRASLVHWIWIVHEILLGKSGQDSSLHLAVQIMDAYLCVAPEIITHPHLQLIGAASYLIATKYEQTYPPKIRDLCTYSQVEQRSEKQIVQCEQMILQALDFRITVPTSYHFLLRFLELSRSEDNYPKDSSNAEWFCEVGLMYSRTLAFPRHILAAAAVCLDRALKWEGGDPEGKGAIWPAACRRYSGIGLEDVSPCCRLLLDIIVKERKNDRPFIPKYGAHRDTSNSGRDFCHANYSKLAYLFPECQLS